MLHYETKCLAFVILNNNETGSERILHTLKKIAVAKDIFMVLGFIVELSVEEKIVDNNLTTAPV